MSRPRLNGQATRIGANHRQGRGVIGGVFHLRQWRKASPTSGKLAGSFRREIARHGAWPTEVCLPIAEAGRNSNSHCVCDSGIGVAIPGGEQQNDRPQRPGAIS